MTWLYLAVAILLEVSGTTCMKLSQGFTKLVPSILLFVLQPEHGHADPRA
jgi:small multidrug resistance pump